MAEEGISILTKYPSLIISGIIFLFVLPVLAASVVDFAAQYIEYAPLVSLIIVALIFGYVVRTLKI